MSLDIKFSARLKHWNIVCLTDINAGMLQQQMNDHRLKPCLLMGEVMEDNSGLWPVGTIVKTGWLTFWDLSHGEVQALSGWFEVAGAPLSSRPILSLNTKQLMETLGSRGAQPITPMH